MPREYNTPPCGTRQGYARHNRRKEDACQPCRKAAAEYATRLNHARRPELVNRQCKTCTNPVRASVANNAKYCEPCQHAAATARARKYNYIRRIAKLHTDITAEYERELREQAHTCPLCGIHMTDAPRQAHSKELDHVIPIKIGGTHTIGNVRIVCKKCNQARPQDGSDYLGQPTLWAQGPAPTPPKPPKPPKHLCHCGRPLPPGRRTPSRRFCHTCQPVGYMQRRVPERGRQAEALRQRGMTWREIGQQLGYAGDSGPYLAASAYRAKISTE